MKKALKPADNFKQQLKSNFGFAPLKEKLNKTPVLVVRLHSLFPVILHDAGKITVSGGLSGNISLYI